MAHFKNNVFLSWSGPDSSQAANIFFKFLPRIIQNADPFFSPDKIKKDVTWFEAVKLALTGARTGIIFLTKENFKKDWILIEAGGLLTKESTCIVLVGLTIDELRKTDSIFSNFNVTSLLSEAELLKMFKSIRDVIAENVIDSVLESTFELFYPEIEKEIKNIAQVEEPSDLSIFNDLAGNYRLSIFERNGEIKYREDVIIGKDGRYWLRKPNGDFPYFQLQIINKTRENFEWQKIQMVKDKVSKDVHSIEHLRKNGTTINGSDTFGYILQYIRYDDPIITDATENDTH